jgi:hypothetical protein
MITFQSDTGENISWNDASSVISSSQGGKRRRNVGEPEGPQDGKKQKLYDFSSVCIQERLGDVNLGLPSPWPASPGQHILDADTEKVLLTNAEKKARLLLLAFPLVTSIPTSTAIRIFQSVLLDLQSDQPTISLSFCYSQYMSLTFCSWLRRQRNLHHTCDGS